MPSKKILITGGEGFIGTHMTKRLRALGHEVSVYDLKSGNDVRDVESLNRAVQGVDAIYHFAALVSVPLCQNQPADSYSTNLLGTFNVLESAVAEKKRSGKDVQFFFAGSSVVYGTRGQENVPLTEDIQDLPQPISNYGIQKLLSEKLIQTYVQNHGLSGLIFRFFNVYGPGQDPTSPYSGVISILQNAIQNNKKFTVYGDGNQTRDFVSVHDLTEACAQALDVSKDLGSATIVNLGTGQAITLNALIRAFEKVSGKSILSEFAAPRDGDVRHSLASIENAKRILGFHPKVSLTQGLSELVQS